MTAGNTYVQSIGTVHDGWVEIDNVRTDDAEFVAEAERLADPGAIGAIGQQVFDLGLAVRRLAQTDAQVARISDQLSAFEREVQSLTDKASLTLREQVEAVLDADIGALPQATREASDELREAIRQALDTNDKQSAASLLVSEVTEQNSKAFGHTLGDVRALLDSSRDDSPLAAMRRELINEFTGPLQEMTKQLAEVRAVTVDRAGRARAPADGVDYEVIVGEILIEAATACGDAVTPTGTETGIGRSKVGDFVVEVTGTAGRAGRFVVEAKASQLRVKEMRKQLDAAAENRGAVAAILVIADAEYGWKKQPLKKFGTGRYVVVAERDDPSQLALRVAYQMARADVMADLAESKADSGLDFDALQAHLEQARVQLDTTSTIKSALTSAEKDIARAKVALGTMRASIEELLSQIQDELKPAD